MTRSSPEAIPARSTCGWTTSPGLRLPPRMIPIATLWKTRWEQFLRNRAVLRTDREENTGRRAHRQDGDRLARAARGGLGAVPALARHLQPARAVGPAPAVTATST